jgi:hypothetical protein
VQLITWTKTDHAKNHSSGDRDLSLEEGAGANGNGPHGFVPHGPALIGRTAAVAAL